MSASHESHSLSFYGTATVGTKGQIVIPAEARAEAGIEPGDKLVILGMGDHKMIGVCPVASVEALFQSLSKKLDVMRSLIDQQKAERKQ